MIRDTARLDALIAELRAFVREECLPLEASIDREDAIPEAIVEHMRALGLFSHSIPEAYGGAGFTMPRLARGELTGCLALNDPDAGSDASGSPPRPAGAWPTALFRSWVPPAISRTIRSCGCTETFGSSGATRARARSTRSTSPGNY